MGASAAPFAGPAATTSRAELAKALLFWLGVRAVLLAGVVLPQVLHVAAVAAPFPQGEDALLDHGGLLLLERFRRQELLVAPWPGALAVWPGRSYALAVLPLYAWLGLGRARAFGASLVGGGRHAALALASALASLLTTLVALLGLTLSARAAAAIQPATLAASALRLAVLLAPGLPAWRA